ncbi:MAG: hypothetical protein ABIE22_00925 [archaeon]
MSEELQGKKIPEIKNQIKSIIRLRGPSLPVHISREVGVSMLFSGAFLSELLSEKALKISCMRVGGSPLYFQPGQEPMLEGFHTYLPKKEKEAFLLLKEKSILKDTKLEPAIRVALRSIKDFAVPTKKDNEIFWRYFLLSENEAREKIISTFQKKQLEIVPKQEIEEVKPLKIQDAGKELNIFDKPKKKTRRKKQVQKQDNKFFDKVKSHLAKNSIQMIDLEDFSNNKIILRVSNKGKEELLIAYNKKRINDFDLINAHKKAKNLHLPYSVVSLGEPLKKLDSLIEAIKALSDINKIE